MTRYGDADHDDMAYELDEFLKKHRPSELLKLVQDSVELWEEKTMNMMGDTISRQAAIDAIDKHISTFDAIDANYLDGLRTAISLLYNLPSVQTDNDMIQLQK